MTSSTEARRPDAFGAARHLERHAGFGKRALGAHDALRDGRLGDKEGAGYFLSGQAADEPQRQRDARLRRKQRMAGGEDKAQKIVADIVVEHGLDIGAAMRLLDLHVIADLAVLAVEHFCAAQMIDGAALAGRHQPGGGLVRARPSPATGRGR